MRENCTDTNFHAYELRVFKKKMKNMDKMVKVISPVIHMSSVLSGPTFLYTVYF